MKANEMKKKFVKAHPQNLEASSNAKITNQKNP